MDEAWGGSASRGRFTPKRRAVTTAPRHWSWGLAISHRNALLHAGADDVVDVCELGSSRKRVCRPGSGSPDDPRPPDIDSDGCLSKAVTELFSGRMRVEYHQAYVESGDVMGGYDEAFEGQVNGLLGAGIPGSLTLSVGTALGDVGLRVVLLEAEPDDPGPEWEDVVEVSFTPHDGVLGVTDPGRSNFAAPSFELPVTDYRVRLCARGIDESWDGTVGEDEPLLDHYELQFWPSPPAPDAVLQLTSISSVASHRARDPELAREELSTSWGGKPPSEVLLADPMAEWFTRMDRELAEEILAAGPYIQRQLAYWATERGCREAGIADIDWVAAALRSLSADARLPAPFGDPMWVYERMEDDPANPRSKRMFKGHEVPVDLSAVSALRQALFPHPLYTAFQTVATLQSIVGDDREKDVLLWARAELQRLLAVPGAKALPDSRPPELAGGDVPAEDARISGPDQGIWEPGSLLSTDDPAAQYLDPRPVLDQIADLEFEAPDVLARVATMDPENLREAAFDLARSVYYTSGLNRLVWLSDAFVPWDHILTTEPFRSRAEGAWLMSNPRVGDRTTLHEGTLVPVWPFALRSVRHSRRADPREAVLLVVHDGLRVGGDNRREAFLTSVHLRLDR